MEYGRYECFYLGKQTNRYIQGAGLLTLKTSEANANWERMGPQGPGRWRWGDRTAGSYPRVCEEPTIWGQGVPNGEGGRDGFTRRMLMD